MRNKKYIETKINMIQGVYLDTMNLCTEYGREYKKLKKTQNTRALLDSTKKRNDLRQIFFDNLLLAKLEYAKKSFNLSRALLYVAAEDRYNSMNLKFHELIYSYTHNLKKSITINKRTYTIRETSELVKFQRKLCEKKINQSKTEVKELEFKISKMTDEKSNSFLKKHLIKYDNKTKNIIEDLKSLGELLDEKNMFIKNIVHNKGIYGIIAQKKSRYN